LAYPAPRDRNGVANELRLCLQACRASERSVQTVIAFWLAKDDFHRWHITMQRREKLDGSFEILAFHSDISNCAAAECLTGWTLELLELLVHQGDTVLFEHDSEGKCSRFKAARKVLDTDPRTEER